MIDWEPYRALYIHVPFCKQRCKYCDFATQSASFDDPRIDDYLSALISNLRGLSRKDMLGQIQTVYLGGGTPSYLGNRRLSSLLYALSISMHLTPEVECTLEANPDSLTLPMVKDLFALGVTRISLGVQSFNDKMLNVLGRIHNAYQAKQAIGLAQQRFDNISIDLMCGLPGQTLEMFASDLHTALELGVKHVSVYPLMVEEGTPFYSMEQDGLIQLDDDLSADCMDLAAEILSAGGMHRYEVASYCYPGFESRHNSAYWTGVPYLGLGAGAVSMRQNDLCRQRLDDRGTIIEELDPFQMAAEDLMLGMRMRRGIAQDDLDIASILLPDAKKVFESLESDRYIVKDHERWVPTHKGWLFGNQLYGRILDLAP